MTKEEAYDVAANVIMDANIKNSLNNLGKVIGCVLDDDLNIIKRFYDDNTADCPDDAKISIFLTMHAAFWSGVIRTYERDINAITLRLVHVENPIVSKAELVEKLVRCNKSISKLFDECRVADKKSVKFKKVEEED